MRLPRTTGALSGLLITLLGLWGGLIPFIGPYFHYAFGGYQTWHYTSQRLWLCIVPGAVAVIGGLMLMRASSRVGGLTAGWVALAAGAWFAVGPVVSLLWHHTIYAIGTPAGGYTRQMLEWVGYFYGLGAAIVGLAAFAMGRYFSRPRIVEEPVAAAEAVADRPVAERRAGDRRVTQADAADAAVAERRHGYADPVDEPVSERSAYTVDPAVDRGAYAELVGERGAYAEPATEADRGAYAEPAAGADRGAYGEPAAERGTATESAGAVTSSDRADVPAADRAPAAEPVDAPADAPGTTYRRRPGLLRRLRGES
jgi:hypothetical protein